MKAIISICILFCSAQLFAQSYELKTFYENGNPKSVCVYTDNSNFFFTKFHSNGNISETGQFVNGKMDGAWNTYSDAGVHTGEAYYAEGNKTGNWRIYDESGILKFKIQYEDNKMLSKANFDMSGNALSEIRTR